MESCAFSSTSRPPGELPREDSSPLPTVSILMPIYNEAESIDGSLAAVLGQDYPPHLVEILIAEGPSDDETSERIRQIVARNSDRCIRVLPNPKRTAGAAMNRMLAQARGDIVVRIDGHSFVSSDYVRQCVSALGSSDAFVVGGCITAAGRGFVGRAIAMAVASFWGNGGSRFRGGPRTLPVYVDAIPFGAWRRETLQRLGPFVEWPVNEDCELNARILDAGGRILLHPAIRSVYVTRHSLNALARQYFRYGKLKCLVVACHPRQVRVRYVAPLMVVLLLLAPPLTVPFAEVDSALLFSAPLAYVCGIGIASLRLAAGARHLKSALVLPAVLATLHFSYGLGTLWGIGGVFRFLLDRWKRPRGRFRSHRSGLVPEMPREGSEPRAPANPLVQ
jgi:succinoglycan biosynthesis protein ExoA